ncbi:MAG: Glu-tRNA(Gln) amidotransferase subunit GatE [Candidatus Altiarchaeota archaeon]|nr:Glu-tRNA(Gln) amidotransferase subunit GatE [Candidatus Altiarchaeota archaeon]
MTDPDYTKLGLKCGIEIHQQLDTNKLFCNCPSEIRDDEPDVVVRRRLRAVAGEIGGVDPAALHEFLRGREFVYEAYSQNNCLVELDEEPPHPLNRDALVAVIEIAFLLNARPADELAVMRKTVIDGSNTSGFQRTVLVALDGFIETTIGRVNIPSICLEEDAARKIREENNVTVYRLDRLGIPLVELGTDPDIKTPAHAREVAEKLGLILRATGKVKRGLGTIRQDLNVSIAEGERIEVKGVQDLRLIAKIVEGEVARQMMLVSVKKELEARNVCAGDLDCGFVDVSDVFRETEAKVVRGALGKGGIVLAVRLKGFTGLLKYRLGPELAQYARAVAGVKGIFHSDELPAYGIGEKEVLEVRSKLGLGENDAFALVAEDAKTAKDALNSVIDRAKAALKGVPKETRRATPEGGSEFMRPLPGSARMYPETDEPPIVIDGNYLSKIKKNLPELPEEKLDRYASLGLSRELAGQLVRSRHSGLFEELMRDHPEIKPSFIATMIISFPKEVRKRFHVEIDGLGEDHYSGVLSLIKEKKISRDSVPEILAEIGRNPEAFVEETIKAKGLTLLSEGELAKVVGRIISENKGKPPGFILGRVMAEVRGRADAETVKRFVEERAC